MPDPDRLLLIALHALDNAARLGSPTGEQMAAALRRRIEEPAGIDDTELLAEVAQLEAAGKGRGAATVVARRHGGTPAKVAAIERRLQRKRKDRQRPCRREIRV